MTDQIETDQITPQDAEYVLTKQEIAAILFAVDRDDRAGLLDLMGPLHAADIADLLEQLNTFDRRRLIELYGMEFGGDILSELEENLREEVIQLLSPQVLAQAVRDLDSDDVVDLVEDLNAGQKEAILDALEDTDRLAVEDSLTYPDASAGRLMQREVVHAPEFWSVGDTIDYMRASDELPEQFYHIVLVDPKHRPIGLIGLSAIMALRARHCCRIWRMTISMSFRPCAAKPTLPMHSTSIT